MPPWRIAVCISTLITVWCTPCRAAEYTLEDLYRLALVSSEKINSSVQDLVIAQIGRDRAVADLLPTISAFANHTQYSRQRYNEYEELIQPRNSSMWGTRLEQQISLSLREITAVRMAGDGIDKSKRDLVNTREEYLLQVAQAYYGVLKARKDLEIAEASVARLSAYREAAQRRVQVGESARTILLRAESELSNARTERIKAANAWEQAKTELIRLTDIEEAFRIKEEPNAEQPYTVLADLRQTALEQRPDLQALAFEIRQYKRKVRYQYGAYLPTLSLSGEYAAADQDPNSTDLVDKRLYGVLSVSVPILQYKAQQADAAEARANLMKAELAYADLKKTIIAQVKSAWLELMTQQEAVKSLEDELAYARENYAAVSRQFTLGFASSLDVMDANTVLVSAERKLAAAHYACQFAALKLKQSTGAPLLE